MRLMYLEYLEHGTQEVSAIIFGMKFINQSTSFAFNEDIPCENSPGGSNPDSGKILPMSADLLKLSSSIT